MQRIKQLTVLSTLCFAACGIEADDRWANEHSLPLSAAAAPGDDDAGAGSPSAITFTAHLPGVEIPVQARVTTSALAQLHVDTYPSEAEASPTHGPLPVGFERAFSPAYCAEIRTKAAKAVGTSALANWYRQQLRRSGGVTLTLPVSPLMGPDFVAALRAGAIAAGAKATAYTLDNPLKPTGVRLEIDFAPGATALLIGDTASVVAEQQLYLTQQSAAVATRGAFVTAMSAKDVLCDLASGAATIKFTIEARVGQSNYTGHTTLSPLRAD